MPPAHGRDGILARTLGPARAVRVRSQVLGRAHLLPDFLVLGPGSSGASSLLALMETHPNVLPGPGETQFFDSRRYTWGVPWYRMQFGARMDRRQAQARGIRPVVTGESSSTYLAHPNAPARAARTVPEASLIVVLRDPTSRAVAHWRQRVEHGIEDRPFREVVEAELGRSGSQAELRIPRQRRVDDPLVVRRGVYLPQLERWLTHFPRERVLILACADRWPSPWATFVEVCGLLRLPAPRPEAVGRQGAATWGAGGGMPDDAEEAERRPTPGRWPAQSHEPEPETLAQLRDFYGSADADLARALGMELGWTTAPTAEPSGIGGDPLSSSDTGRDSPRLPQPPTRGRVSES